MVKRIMAFATVLMLSLSVSMPSFASVATPSNAQRFQAYALNNASENLASAVSYSIVEDSFNYVNPTIDLTQCIVYCVGRHANGSSGFFGARVLADGSFHIEDWNDAYTPVCLMLHIPKSCFPTIGAYKLTVQFYTEVDSFEPHAGYYFWNRKIPNATEVTGKGNDINILHNGGDVQLQQIIQVGSITALDFGFLYDTAVVPFSGRVTACFTSTTSSPSISVGGMVSSDEYSASIADSSASIADSSSAIAEGTSRIAEVVEEIKTTVETSVDNVVSKLDNLMDHDQALADQQIANDNANTDKIIASDEKIADDIMNSYDNSSLTSENEKLSDALAEYEAVENELFDQAADNLSGFEFQNPFDQFTAPLADISYFLNGIYYGLGAFNIPIGFSLTLAIALLCIGWYRFRGG